MISLAEQSSEPIEVEEWLRDLVPRFLENRRKDVEIMLGALAREDFDAIRSLAHNLKGVSGGYGFAPLSALGRALEEAARARDAQEIRDGAEELAAFLKNVRVVFR